MRDEVLRLLRAVDSARFTLDEPRLGLGDDAQDEDRVGNIVAHYKLVRLIGRGGMGSVYEGVRSDNAYEQRVAVKLIRPDISAPGMAARFRRERQILAALEHRNIARLLDGGATDQEPFFVMEYVDGIPITAYCDERHMKVQDRLRLFLQACAAVQHAHSKLIVHRDIKPANMLVTPDGSVKLLDFGVAKLLRGRDVDSGAGVIPGATQFTGRPITPEYASPEQLRDEPASAASDIYSLGVVLYELLAGKRPFEMATRSPVAALRALEREPARSSSAVTQSAAINASEPNARRLRRRLVGELDNIVRKAMHVDPARRYSSVEQLGADIRRYLEDRPVLAQPDSAAYRTSKFVRRNWGGVLATSVAVLALTGGATGALLQARRADAKRAKARRVSTFLQQMLAAPDARRFVAGTLPRAQTTIADLLDNAAQRATVDLAADPSVESAVRRTLGRTYTAIGRYDQAIAQLTRAVAIERAIGAPAMPDIAVDLLDLGVAQLERGDNRAADTLFRQDLAICGSHDQKTDTTHVCVDALHDLGGATWFENKLPESERLLREALPSFRRVYGISPITAILLGNLGGVRDARGAWADAQTLYQQSLVVYAQAGANDVPQRGFTLGNLAANLEQQGQLAAADSLVREAIDLVSRTQSPNHPDVGLSWVQLGGIHRKMGRLALARTETDRGLSILNADAPIARRYFVKVNTSKTPCCCSPRAHRVRPSRCSRVYSIQRRSSSSPVTRDWLRYGRLKGAYSLR